MNPIAPSKVNLFFFLLSKKLGSDYSDPIFTDISLLHPTAPIPTIVYAPGPDDRSGIADVATMPKAPPVIAPTTSDGEKMAAAEARPEAQSRGDNLLSCNRYLCFVCALSRTDLT